jgi:hypothetical protein
MLKLQVAEAGDARFRYCAAGGSTVTDLTFSAGKMCGA